ncbi:dihydrofolate reductase family protein [Candidatus Woesebacteria bacterium]|nr:dihydrofolate reductase family protein [Candidatus Woesebacteria bacterium]
MSDRPVTTLFMIESVDGKISTGDVDELDVDKDFKRIVGVKEGLHQYYDLEKLTDPYSLNTGRVMQKIGVNERVEEPKKMGCSFVIIDNKPHLTERGVEYLAKWVKTLFLVTTNKNHPANVLKQKRSNIVIINYDAEVDLAELLKKLKSEHGVERLTIQSGGTLNAQWIRRGLIDNLSIVVAPLLIGGKATSTLVDGESLHTQDDLRKIKTMKLIKCDLLENSYLHLTYEVMSDTQIQI